MEKEKDWTVLKLLQWTSDYFESKGFESPRTSAELLLGHVLSCKRLDLYLKFDKPVLQPELARFRDAVKRRLHWEPIQYITGETEFYSLRFKVGPSVLIPRPETEILVGRAVQLTGERFGGHEAIRLLDVGTGSGNIAISLAGNIANARIDAIDISEEALDTARANAALHGLEERIGFRRLSLFEAGPDEFTDLAGMVSNPPYVSARDYEDLPEEVRGFEPQCALADGEDGYRFYPELSRRAIKWLRPGGFLIVETGMGGAGKVADMFAAAGLGDVEIINDLNGIERVVCGWRP